MLAAHPVEIPAVEGFGQPVDPALEFGDLLVVVQALNLQDDIDVIGIDLAQRPVLEVSVHGGDQPFPAAVADPGGVGVGDEIEQLVRTVTTQERQLIGVRRLVTVEVRLEVALFQSIRVQLISQLGAVALLFEEPGQVLGHGAQGVRRPLGGFRAGAQHGVDSSVAGTLTLEELLPFGGIAQVRRYHPEAFSGQLLEHVVDGGVRERHHSDSRSRPTDHRGDDVQDRLCLPGARWTINHRERILQGAHHRIALADIGAERVHRKGDLVIWTQLDRAFFENPSECAVRVNEAQPLMVSQEGAGVAGQPPCNIAPVGQNVFGTGGTGSIPHHLDLACTAGGPLACTVQHMPPRSGVRRAGEKVRLARVGGAAVDEKYFVWSYRNLLGLTQNSYSVPSEGVLLGAAEPDEGPLGPRVEFGDIQGLVLVARIVLVPDDNRYSPWIEHLPPWSAQTARGTVAYSVAPNMAGPSESGPVAEPTPVKVIAWKYYSRLHPALQGNPAASRLVHQPNPVAPPGRLSGAATTPAEGSRAPAGRGVRIESSVPDDGCRAMHGTAAPGSEPTRTRHAVHYAIRSAPICRISGAHHIYLAQ